MRVHSFKGNSSRAAVYVLQRLDRRRFKIGWSIAPLQRIRLLPEFDAGELDVAASRALWLPDRKRAEQVESAVHKCLAPHGAEAGHRPDGFSEWFEPPAHAIALRMLSQVPLDQRSTHRARLVPLKAEAPPPDAAPIETGPLDTWWALEDLWSRLATHCPVTVERDGDVHQIVIGGFKDLWEGPVGALRAPVMDCATYPWHAADRADDFVRLIAYRGSDLVCTMTSLRCIERWPEGADLVWQVKGFLLRLERRFPPRHAAQPIGGRRA